MPSSSRAASPRACREIAGIDHPKVISYPELLSGARRAGESVAIIGAGGIGFDVATFLTHRAGQRTISRSGASTARSRSAAGSCRHGRRLRRAASIYCSASPAGSARRWARPPGWIHRTALKQRGVVMRNGVSYQRIDDAGLHIATDGGAGDAGRRTRGHLRGAGVRQRACDRTRRGPANRCT